jgi:PAS domain S-box-containing protein
MRNGKIVLYFCAGVAKNILRKNQPILFMPSNIINNQLSVYLEAVEIMQHGVMFLDREGNILSVNRRFAQELGYSKDQFEPKTIFQVNPHFNFIAWKKLWEDLETKGKVSLDTEHITSKGENVPTKLRGILVEAGGEKYCQAIVEGELANSQEDLYLARFCLDNVKEMITWVNPDGSIFYANKAIRETLGFSAEELLSMKIYDLEPDYTETDWASHWEDLKTKKWIQRETERLTKSGQAIPVELSLHYMNYNGREYKMAFLRDLRQHHRKEEIMTLSFHALDQAAEMIFWLEADGSFYYHNDSFIKKTGYDEVELASKKVVDVIPEVGLKEFHEKWKVIRKEKLIHSERTLVCKDGTKIPVESTVTMVKLNSKEYACVTLRDVTKRLRREEELKKLNEEKERLNRQLQAENIILKEEIEVGQGFNNIISRSAAYRPVLRQIGQVADTEATVLVLGETGTGKELIAKAIHRLSGRSEYPMVTVNCGALPENLIESELFGHEKGAFTGAFQQKTGRFEMAHHGTIFLDEIGELPLDLQAKLLRVLQEGEFQRLGGTKTIRVDVRVIAATNRNLEEEVEKGRFREDLFYRLNVFPIVNIPLRDRKDDIPLLVRHFIEKYNLRMGKRIEEVPQSVMKELMDYEYPGNVRELENLIERAVILSPGNKLTSNFQFKKTKSGAKKSFASMDDMQRMYILEALRRTKGKVTGSGGAAELLKMNDKTLYSRMSKLGVGRNDFID